MSLPQPRPDVDYAFRELPRPPATRRPEPVPELESLRKVAGAGRLVVYRDAPGKPKRLLGVSPPELLRKLPKVLVVKDHHFVERGGCTFAFDVARSLPILRDPATLDRTPDGRSIEYWISKALGRLVLRSEDAAVRQIVDGESACFALSAQSSFDLLDEAEKIAPSNRPVLILGETGTGKELIARLVHRASGRDKFVVSSMAQVKGESAISELFGHLKGAYTGATTRRLGAFLAAESGSLFLDEIAEMPGSSSAMLLRAIEEKKVKPLGADNTYPAPARVIAATNRPESLRQELLYRFVHRILLLPLRFRRPDIRSIALFIAFREGFDLTEKALQALTNLSEWRGNVRELEYFLIHAAMRARGPLLGVEDVMNNFGSALRIADSDTARASTVLEVRKSLGISLRNFATLLKVPKSTLHDIESGLAPERERDVLRTIGEKLEALLDESKPPSPPVTHELKRFISEE